LIAKKDSLPVFKHSASTFHLNVYQNCKNHFKILILEEDCTLPTCSTGTCGGEQISCTRTCTNGVFGNEAADCAADRETKTDTCALLACGEFEIHKNNIMDKFFITNLLIKKLTWKSVT
jgi:hypothetical protein